MGNTTPGGQAFNAELASSGPGIEGFHEWLQALLKTRNMSQRQLAQRSGVDHSSISRLIRGDRVPTLRTAMKLARGMESDDRPRGRRAGAVSGGNPAARVEYALRADDRLSEDAVREVMLYYLAVRAGRLSAPATTPPAEARSRAPVPIVARMPGGSVPTILSERRQTPRRE